MSYKKHNRAYELNTGYIQPIKNNLVKMKHP
jgi:hypothetical protein